MSRSMGVAGEAAGLLAPHATKLPQDPDARDALGWLERGMPDDEIVYDDAAPRLTKEQLAEFKPASFMIRRRPR